MSHRMDSSPTAPRYVTFFNPIAKRLLAAGVPLGLNGRLTIRGRTSGLPRTTPVAIIEGSSRRWIWAPGVVTGALYPRRQWTGGRGAEPAAATVNRSYAQAGPPGNDHVGFHPFDDDELLAARCAGHEPHGSPPDAELVGDEAEERLV